jgi:hypothetical protein
MAARRYSRLLALILVAAQALSLGHLVLVPHAISPVDGGLLHVAHGQTPDQVEPAAVPRPASVQQSADTGSDAGSHCPVADTLRRTPGAPGPAIAAHIGLPDLSPLASPSDVPRVAAGLSLYRLAPKQSPPV